MAFFITYLYHDHLSSLIFSVSKSNSFVFFNLAIIFSSLLYSLTHFSLENPFHMASIFVTSLVMAYLFYITSNIWFPILFHMLSNAIYICLGLFHHEYRQLVIYHRFNFYYWVVIILSAVLFVYLLYLPKRIKEKSSISANVV